VIVDIQEKLAAAQYSGTGIHSQGDKRCPPLYEPFEKTAFDCSRKVGFI
jgi:hypothetical protein